jgi:hypothetical protein
MSYRCLLIFRISEYSSTLSLNKHKLFFKAEKRDFVNINLCNIAPEVGLNLQENPTKKFLGTFSAFKAKFSLSDTSFFPPPTQVFSLAIPLESCAWACRFYTCSSERMGSSGPHYKPKILGSNPAISLVYSGLPNNTVKKLFKTSLVHDVTSYIFDLVTLSLILLSLVWNVPGFL